MGIMKGDSGGGGGGEIVQVQGGHIVRATGRKDRHSKVYTSKGPRDRRVRLSAHTAIQFYDVQDRLGFDRPSKAVDWLITKAKPSIDKLAHLPNWNPTTAAAPPEHQDPPDQCGGGGYAGGDGGGTGTAFMPPPPSQLDSDTMKRFFPTSSGCPPEILMPRGGQQSEELGLSLHSFQDTAGQAGLFPGSDPDGFGSGGNYQRIMGWSSTDPAASISSSSALSGGFFFINHHNSSSSGSQPLMMIPQRGTLQSSNNQFAPPSLGGFDELPIGSVFGRGRFGPDGLTGYGFPGRDVGVMERPPHSSTSPNSDHH